MTQIAMTAPTTTPIITMTTKMSCLGEEYDVLILFGFKGFDLRPEGLETRAQVIEQCQYHIFHVDVER